MSRTLFFVLSLALLNLTSVRAGRVLLALFALDLGASQVTVGMLAAAFSAPPMLLAFMAGRVADRFGSRWPLLLGAAGASVGLLVPAVLPGLPALFVTAALMGVSFAFYTVSLQNLVGVLSTGDARARNFANYSLMLAVASFLGPLLAGFAIDHTGHRATCVAVAGLGLVPVLMLLAGGRALPGGTRAPREGGAGANALRNPDVLRLLVIGALVQSGLDLFQFYLPVYGHEIGLSASSIGVVLAAFSAAAFFVRMVMPVLLKRFSERNVLIYAFGLGAASFVMMPLVRSVELLSVVSFLFGLGMGCGQPITMMLTFSRSAAGRSGEALGLRMTVNHLTRVLGPVIFGGIGAAFGVLAVFWLNALLLGSGAGLAARHVKRRAS